MWGILKARQRSAICFGRRRDRGFVSGAFVNQGGTVKTLQPRKVNHDPAPVYTVREDAVHVDKAKTIQQFQMAKVSATDEQRSYERTQQQPEQTFPVYVMLPLDTIIYQDNCQYFARVESLTYALKALKDAGVEGVMIDVWWGYVEHSQPNDYDFSAYKALFDKVASYGLKIQCVMSFHAAGPNVGDTCQISLPQWVLDVGQQNPDIFFTNKNYWRDQECISLGCDELPVFYGRTAVQVYKDFIEVFSDTFQHMFGDTIVELTIGMGPAGELRYPSYPEGFKDGWRFPGIGEFTCYDKYMLEDLKQAAEKAGQPNWGTWGPHDAGSYNDLPHHTAFFHPEFGGWRSDYGHFFLSWYSGKLLRHLELLLDAAWSVVNQEGRPRALRAVRPTAHGYMYEYVPAVKLGIKVAGIHWWYAVASHAAELTAGYYNVPGRDGYEPVMRILRRYDANMSFTCVEMRDTDHPMYACCSPEGLLSQVIGTSKRLGQPVCGENALQRYDREAFDRIAQSAFGQNAMRGKLHQLTFLRMSDMMCDNWPAFSEFIERLRNPPRN